MPACAGRTQRSEIAETDREPMTKGSGEGKRRQPEGSAAPQPVTSARDPSTALKSEGKPARRDGAAARSGGQPGNHVIHGNYRAPEI